MGQRLQNLASGFDKAADTYGDDPNSGFDHYGQLLAEFSRAASGERILDICCGTGAVALPLAQHIGPTGSLLGVDVSTRMMERAKARMDSAGISWAAFQQQDVGALQLDDRFDLATCGFSIQFFSDRQIPLQRMKEHLQPGGRIAISLWAQNFGGAFKDLPHDAVKRIRPDVYEPPTAGTIGGSEEKMAAFLEEAGFKNIVTERHEFDTYDDRDEDAWWDEMKGGGFSRLLVQLSPEEVEDVRTWLVTEREKLRGPDGQWYLPKPAILGLGWA